MRRARVAFAVAAICTCVSAVVQVGCVLSDKYSDGDGDSGRADLDASLTDATALADGPPSGDVTIITDSGPRDVNVLDAAADGACNPGPWGDYCCGLPEIVAPGEGGTVGKSFEVQVTAPSCIKTIEVYLNSSKAGIIEASTFTSTLTVQDPGQYFLNASAWNNTNDAHVANRVYFTVAPDL